MSFLGDLTTFIGAIASSNNAYQNTNIVNNILSTVNTKTLAAGANSSTTSSSNSSTSSSSSSISFENNTPKLIPFDTLPSSGPLSVINNTGGLVFPYTPSISETVSIQYKGYDLTHSNESYNAYVKTDNACINLGELTWTADTQENALYMLGVIHFFRSYSLMDFGRGKSGKPPSPMWFTAYGKSMYDKVPVLLDGYDFVLPPNVDYVPVTDSAGNVNWVPMKLTISGIKLKMQHAPNYWLGTFDLAQFKAGKISFSSNTSTTSSANTVGSTLGNGASSSTASGGNVNNPGTVVNAPTPATATPAATTPTSGTTPSYTINGGLDPTTGFASVPLSSTNADTTPNVGAPETVNATSGGTPFVYD